MRPPPIFGEPNKADFNRVAEVPGVSAFPGTSSGLILIIPWEFSGFYDG